MQHPGDRSPGELSACGRRGMPPRSIPACPDLPGVVGQHPLPNRQARKGEHHDRRPQVWCEELAWPAWCGIPPLARRTLIVDSAWFVVDVVSTFPGKRGLLRRVVGQYQASETKISSSSQVFQ